MHTDTQQCTWRTCMMRTQTFEILLVEDNPHDALLVIEAIADNPAYSLRAVDDGDQAIAYLRRESPFADAVPPALILLDLKLPKKNGYEILTEIRGDQSLKDIPVIVLTNTSA